MILSNVSLRQRLHEFIVRDADDQLINPASIDIRLGKTMLRESRGGSWIACDLSKATKESPFRLDPGEFTLIDTFETIAVPNGFAMELKLKSSRAREGYDHSNAFWVDPGWNGVLTMEIQNVSRYTFLPVYCGMKFAQVIIHQLNRAANPAYGGRYNHAEGVEASK